MFLIGLWGFLLTVTGYIPFPNNGSELFCAFIFGVWFLFGSLGMFEFGKTNRK
jgi:hypothetical protein